MIRFFDSVFCIIYKQYEKWGENSPFTFAEGIVVVFQIFLLYDIFTLLSIIDLFPKKIENIKLYALLVAMIIYLINHHRYRKKHKEILQKSKKKYDKIYLISIYGIILISIIFPVLIGIMRNNYGVNI